MDLTACELFAGVGGFHLGLKKSGWKVVWSNQWEPGKKVQWASDCYRQHFPGTPHENDDIAKVKDKIPSHTLLVGGFPCQDYSVATTNAHGIHGRKGVLWWEIYHILKTKNEQGTPVPFVLLENVDRLLKSPAKQRGRDFGIMLWCLNDLGYTVEWRMINAADYGFPQKRRRTFIFATMDPKVTMGLYPSEMDEDTLLEGGFFSTLFPVVKGEKKTISILPEDLQKLSDGFKAEFHNSGYMRNGRVLSISLRPAFKGNKRTLRDIIEDDVDARFYLKDEEIGDQCDPKGKKNTWRYCKGAKREQRITKKGYTYYYTEGGIPFPDNIDSPSRTMLTSEGNMRPNRISHVIEDPTTHRLRKITPLEAERLDGFEDDWTAEMPDRWRYFCMGNALVVGLVEKMGTRIAELASASPNNNNPRKRKKKVVIESLDRY
jgi:DNA (cytosine-5)-methyltransferase 1